MRLQYRLITFPLRSVALLCFPLLLVFFCSATNAHNINKDSVTQALQQQGKDTFRINTLNLLSELILFDTDSAEYGRQLAEEALALCAELIVRADTTLKKALLKKEAEACNNVGYYYRLVENPAGALEYYTRSLEIRERLGLKRQIAGSLNNIASVLINIGEYSKATNYALRALRINEELGNKPWIARNNQVLGRIHNELKNYEQGLRYYLTALAVAEETGEKSVKKTSTLNIGNCYYFLKKPDSAYIYYQAALDGYIIREKDKPYAYNGLGNILKDKGQTDSALYYYQKAAAIYEKLEGRREGLDDTYINIGSIYLKKRDYMLAETSYLKAFNYVNEVYDQGGILQATEHLYKLYHEKGDHEKAFRYLLSHNILKDSLTGAEKTRAVDELRIAFESEKKDREIVNLNNTRRLQNFEILQQRQLINLKESENKQKLTMLALAKEQQRNQQLLSEKLKASIKLKEIEAGLITSDNELLKKNQELQESKLQEEKKITRLLIGISLAIALLAFLLYNRYKLSRNYSEELEQKNRIIDEERNKAIANEAYKTQFLVNMSHEIRTPLHAINGMMNVLSEKEPRSDQRAYLQVMHKSAESLLSIINNILDITKIESGKIVFEENVFDPSETMSNVISMLRPNAEEKNLVLKCYSHNLPYMVIGDSVRLSQILINLVSNAIKFTEKGYVAVELQTNSEEINPDEAILEFTVRDTGIGISQEQISRIFDKFVQADTSITRKFGGSGLGLSITKQLVELQNGSIEVHSIPGDGTIFNVKIPYRLSPMRKMAETSYPETYSFPDKLRLLLIEDNAYNRLVAEETLLAAIPGVQLKSAINGEVGLELLEDTPFDLVLIDLQMPVMDGYTAVKIIRNHTVDRIRSIPVIAVSANASTEEKNKCTKAGMNGYITKPFNKSDILKALKTTLDNIQN